MHATLPSDQTSPTGISRHDFESNYLQSSRQALSGVELRNAQIEALKIVCRTMAGYLCRTPLLSVGFFQDCDARIDCTTGC